MKCPSCNKFAAYNTDNEPEIELECENGQVTGTVRILLTSECCGDDLKESTFDVSEDLTEEILDELVKAMEAHKVKIKREDIDLEDNTKRKVSSEWKKDDTGKYQVSKFDPKEECTEFDIRDEGGELTDRTEMTVKKTLKSGKVVERRIPPRYQRRFFGAAINYTVKVSFPYQKTLYVVKISRDWQDEVQASGMDELV